MTWASPIVMQLFSNTCCSYCFLSLSATKKTTVWLNNHWSIPIAISIAGQYIPWSISLCNFYDVVHMLTFCCS